MPMPNYRDGSIVNLVSSIESSYSLGSQYGNLKGLDSEELSEFDSVVLILIDGLGSKYLETYQKGSFISRKMDQTITSVFPTTTSAGITSLATGVAPKQHAVTGWFMYLKEIGMVTQILPFMPRIGGMSLGDVALDPSMFIDQEIMFDRLPVQSRCIIKDEIIDSEYTAFMAGGSLRMPYADLAGFYDRIRESCRGNGERRFIYSYWSHFDTLCHKYGVDSPVSHEHFKEIDEGIEALWEDLDGSGACVLLTADHGQIDVDRDTTIDARDHPRLYECLTLPLCGESRAAFCYVRPSRAGQFERYVENELSERATLLKGPEMIEEGYFGLGAPNARLYERVGDYVLLMRENYVIKDSLYGERGHVMRGYHGGLDDWELYVPFMFLR